MRLIDAAHARSLFLVFRGWFGPPAVYRGERLVDGRLRVSAWHALGYTDPPRVVAETSHDEARLLVTAGHYERALVVLGDVVSPQDAHLILRLPREMCLPLVALARRRGPRVVQRGALKREREAVIENVRRLRADALEGATITADDLTRALGDWA